MALFFISICTLYVILSLSGNIHYKLSTMYIIQFTLAFALTSKLTAQNTAYAMSLNSSYSNICCNNLIATFTLNLRTTNTSSSQPWFINKDAGAYSYYWSDGYAVLNTMDTTIVHSIQTPFTFTITTCCSTYARSNYSFLCPNTNSTDGTALSSIDVTTESPLCDGVDSKISVNRALYSGGNLFCPDPNNCPTGPLPMLIPNYVLMEGAKIIYEGPMPNTISNVSVGTHTYTLFDKSSNECGFDFLVSVEPTYSTVLNLPTAFSPNSDGHNDVFCIQNKDICFDNYSMLIFDKWGEKVFESNHFSICWDGTFKNKLLDPDVFVYHVKVTMDNGQNTEKKGNVTLIR